MRGSKSVADPPRNKRPPPARVNHDANVLAVFDIFGTYLVDVFYNSHYRVAKQRVKVGQAQSVTDEYRTIIMSYSSALRSNERYYKTLVASWHDHYRTHAIGGSMVLADFQDKILSQFVPATYYRDFSEAQKDETMRKIIMQTVNDFCDVVLGGDMLRRVIDDHMNADNVTLLQQRMEDILISQREVFHTKFARESTRPSALPVDRQLVDRLRAEIDDLKREILADKRALYELRVEHQRALNIIAAMTSERSVDVPKTPAPTPPRAPKPAEVTPPKPAEPDVSWLDDIASEIIDDPEDNSEEEQRVDAKTRREQMLKSRPKYDDDPWDDNVA